MIEALRKQSQAFRETLPEERHSIRRGTHGFAATRFKRRRQMPS
jgi:hypothetical protein